MAQKKARTSTGKKTAQSYLYLINLTRNATNERKRERKAGKQRQSKRIVINENREDIHAPTISLRGRREKRDDS